jgi:transcriptional regulator with XRE-family HTH domain
MNELSRRLRQLRIESGMSQSEVGRQVGLSRSAVTQIESGNRDVTADEVVRFSTLFRHSPVALLSGLRQGTGGSVGDKDEMLDDILRALPGQGLDSAELRSSLDRLFELSRQLTETESVLGVAVYGPQAFAFRGTNPRTHWEAAHQGYAVAEDERQRLDLGSAPIRDVPETLATLRVRMSRLALPESVSCVYLHTPETGPLVVVNRNSSPEERRFWMVHGLAHLLFEPERRWLVCSRDDMSRRHEVRADAFAGRFLMPTRGVERYLHSIGRDTMGSSLGGVLEVFSDRAAVPKDKSRVRVSGRSRRGGREFNAFELSQVADYFGVTRSLAAHVLGNLRFLSDSARDRLIDMATTGESDRVLSSGGLAREGQERVAYISRLLVLATEARRRGALSADRVEQIARLSGLDDEERVRLLATGDSGLAEDRDSGRRRLA